MHRYARHIALSAAAILAMLAAPALFAQSPVGMWKTVSDKTGKVESIVKIYESGGVLYGNIEQILTPEDQGKTCTKCPPPQTNKPLVGLMIIWGMKQEGNEWVNGSIMDPDDGTVYRCKMKMDGRNLVVRGFIGFSLLGRSQTWYPN